MDEMGSLGLVRPRSSEDTAPALSMWLLVPQRVSAVVVVDLTSCLSTLRPIGLLIPKLILHPISTHFNTHETRQTRWLRRDGNPHELLLICSILPNSQSTSSFERACRERLSTAEIATLDSRA